MKFWTRSWRWGADGCRSCLSALAWAKVWPSKPHHKRLKLTIYCMDVADLFQTPSSSANAATGCFFGDLHSSISGVQQQLRCLFCVLPQGEAITPHTDLSVVALEPGEISRCPLLSQKFKSGGVLTLKCCNHEMETMLMVVNYKTWNDELRKRLFNIAHVKHFVPCSTNII